VSRRQLAVGTLLVALMAGFGVAVHAALGLVRHVRPSAAGAASATPPSLADLRPEVRLPGSLYLASGGDLLRLRGDTVSAVLRHDANRRWMQPAVATDGSLVLVARGAQSSDLWTVGGDGDGARRLTDDAAPRLRDGSLERDHWAFHPRPGGDGRLWYSYDAPKAGFRVDLAVWSRRAGTAAATRWSTPEGYTGGDVEPLPLPSGGVIFARYTIDGQEHIRSRLWLQSSPRDPGRPLTAAADDCSQPDLSPDGGMLAMVCTRGQQAAYLEVAGFDGRSLGAPRQLQGGPLCAFPTWAPDGHSLVYMAPDPAGQGFALWWLDGASAAAPAPPRQVVEGLVLDATSRPAWGA
jgi:hypothetical protein